MTGDQSEPPDEAQKDIKGKELIIVPERGDVTVIDEQVTELQEQLAGAKDSHREDIFYFFFAAMIAVDIFAFPYIGSTVGIIIVGFLQCILMLGMAKRLGVEEPALWLAMIMRALADRIKK